MRVEGWPNGADRSLLFGVEDTVQRWTPDPPAGPTPLLLWKNSRFENASIYHAIAATKLTS